MNIFNNYIYLLYLNILLLNNLGIYNIELVVRINKSLNKLLAYLNQVVETRGDLKIISNQKSFYIYYN